MSSDHSPLLVKTYGSHAGTLQPQFKFQSAWLTHLNFNNVVKKQWKDNIPFTQNIIQLSAALWEWNRNQFGNVFQRKRKLWARLEGVQRKLTKKKIFGMIKLERKIQKELETTLQREELIWYQRSREDWIASGDRNTKFYHASTLVRRSRNKIESLKNANGEWITALAELENMIQEYYKNLFHEEERTCDVRTLLNGFRSASRFTWSRGNSTNTFKGEGSTVLNPLTQIELRPLPITRETLWITCYIPSTSIDQVPIGLANTPKL